MGDLHRLIAFDLDGTLIDSCRDLADSANELVVELGGRPLAEDAIEGMVGGGAALLVQRALKAAGLDHPSTAVARFLAIYDTRLLAHTRLYEGIADVLEYARRRARLAVLTNKPLAPTERILEGLGIRHLFEDVVGGDGLYGRKPDPAGLTALMAAAGTPRERTLLVGDSFVDYETARQVSVPCCLVSYGFGYRRFPRDTVQADLVVDDVHGLHQALREFLDAKP